MGSSGQDYQVQSQAFIRRGANPSRHLMGNLEVNQSFNI